MLPSESSASSRLCSAAAYSEAGSPGSASTASASAFDRATCPLMYETEARARCSCAWSTAASSASAMGAAHVMPSACASAGRQDYALTGREPRPPLTVAGRPPAAAGRIPYARTNHVRRFVPAGRGSVLLVPGGTGVARLTWTAGNPQAYAVTASRQTGGNFVSNLLDLGMSSVGADPGGHPCGACADLPASAARRRAGGQPPRSFA